MIRTQPAASAFFQGVDQLYHPGYDVKLPIFYYDNTSFTAIYTAATAQVRKALPSPDMHPVELYPGRCLVALTAFEYRRTDIDPYNEFSVTALIRYGKRAIPGVTSGVAMLKNEFEACILQLPVTSERARRGGVEMAGYPKFLADITFAESGGGSACTVAENGKRILTLTGKRIGTSRGKLAKYKLYTRRNGVVLGANLYINPQQHAQAPGWGNAQLDLGAGHPMAEQLRGFDLSSQAMIYQYTPQYEAILFGSKNLMDD
jgi:hypothetical protein